MNVLIVYCHPEPTSFNAALRDAAIEFFEEVGDSVEISDLYGENFDPVEKPEHYKNRACTDRFEPLTEQRHAYKTDTLPMEVTREIGRLENCDLVIFQFPMWWHQQPAMLKGWFDRISWPAGYTGAKCATPGVTSGEREPCVPSRPVRPSRLSPSVGEREARSNRYSTRSTIHCITWALRS